MTNKNKNNKLVFIKNNGLDIKEISISRFRTYIYILSFLFISFIIIAFVSTDIIKLIDKSINSSAVDLETSIREEKEKEYNTMVNKYLSLKSRILNLEKELEYLEDKDENLRNIIKLPPIPDETRKLSVGGNKKDHSQNVLLNNLNIDLIGEMLNSVNRTVNLEKISYHQIEDKINNNLEYLLHFPAIYPVSLDDTYLSSRYGYRTDPHTNRKKQHNGDDFAGPVGIEILATANGKVKFAGRNGYRSDNGNYVVIDHGNGYETKYLHLYRSPTVKTGDIVTRGQVIGYLGYSGKATGPHLHYEVLRNNQNLDPKYFYCGSGGIDCHQSDI